MSENTKTERQTDMLLTENKTQALIIENLERCIDVYINLNKKLQDVNENQKRKIYIFRRALERIIEKELTKDKNGIYQWEAKINYDESKIYKIDKIMNIIPLTAADIIATMYLVDQLSEYSI